MPSAKLNKPLSFNVAFGKETTHLIFNASQVAGFYMNCNAEPKWFNLVASQKSRIRLPETYLEPSRTSTIELL